jgi:GNAT superfamily N-acetyltransferase
MARKLRPLMLQDFEQVPSCCRGCAFWEAAGERDRKCNSISDPELLRSWYRHVTDEWGECGRVAVEDDELLGFVKYAPSRYFPQAATFPSAPKDPNVPLIACLHISEEARHHGLGSVMLRSALRDLVSRGERRVEAFATAQRPAVLDESPMLGVDFLLRNGFTVSRPDPRYPLLKLDLRSLAMWTENLESVFESLRFPTRAPSRAPATWMGGRTGG